MRHFLVTIVIGILCCASRPAAADSPALRGVLSRLAATSGPVTFAILGDNRSGDRVYQKVIQRMLARAPLFVMNTGDVIPNPGDREEWRNFWEISKSIPVPYFLVAGNHDIDDEESQRIWRDEVDLPGNETYYSFTVGKHLFVVLNSCDPSTDRKVDGQQFAWLARTLDPVRYDRQFVFLHHPLFLWKGASHNGASLDRYPKDRDRLHELFVNKGVDVVFVGHEHTYHRMEKDGVLYVITGGAGAPLYGRESFNNVIVVRIDGERLAFQAIDREGVLRDEFIHTAESGGRASEGRR